jgi:serine protease AprX
MSTDPIKDARSHVSDLFGETLARKAGDAFCLAFGGPAAAEFGLEAMAEETRPPSVVIEFTRQPEISAAVIRAVDEIRKTKGWTSLRNVLKKSKLRDLTRGVMTEVMEAGRSDPEILSLQGADLLRHAKIASIRDHFLKTAAPITNEIERRVHAFVHRSRHASQPLPVSAVQVCWLNRTVRVVGDVRALAEVVADESVERIDLPRRLEPDLDLSTLTVGAPQFRKRSKRTGKGIIVAVIDSEVALNHPALKGRVVQKENYTSESWGNFGTHGTAVAGIVASNDGDFSGMAPGATIYNYKVIANNRFLNADSFGGSLAIQQALEDGAHIANCSWGAGPAGDGTSPEAVACDEAWALGMAIVKSAGNRGPGSQTLTTPADADGVIAVGSTDREGTAVQNYSSRGPAGSKPRPHLVAPGGVLGGVGITSCLVGGGFGDCGAGTSFAAPHVAGMLALLLDRDPDLSPDELRDLVLGACEQFEGIDADTQGQGLVSMERSS